MFLPGSFLLNVLIFVLYYFCWDNPFWSVWKQLENLRLKISIHGMYDYDDMKIGFARMVPIILDEEIETF